MSKTVNGTTTEYYWSDGTLLAQKAGENTLVFLYDDKGTPFGFRYNEATYYYTFNAQGDVTGILDHAGNPVARYTYDEWGSPLTITDAAGADVSGNPAHIANINPLRYRAYYFDAESGLYYLQSRYYDPEIGRFISADSMLAGVGQSIQGYNLFAYCYNNPINLTDDSGMWPSWGNIFKAAVYAVAAVAVVVAAPVAVPAIAASLAVSTTVAAVGVAAVATTAAVLSGAELAEGLTGQNPVKDTVGDDTYAAMEVGVMVGTAGITEIAAFNSPVTTSPPSASKPTNPGTPFKPGVTGLQSGVDPNTLIPQKDLATLDPLRIANAVKYAGDKELIVGKTGIIHQGHHRAADAIANGRAIDVYVEPYK